MEQKLNILDLILRTFGLKYTEILLCGSGSGILSALDPGWEKSDPGSWINIPDPEHCLIRIAGPQISLLCRKYKQAWEFFDLFASVMPSWDQCKAVFFLFFRLCSDVQNCDHSAPSQNKQGPLNVDCVEAEFCYVLS